MNALVIENLFIGILAGKLPLVSFFPAGKSVVFSQ